jgi:hypothetical protein
VDVSTRQRVVTDFLTVKHSTQTKIRTCLKSIYSEAAMDDGPVKR